MVPAVQQELKKMTMVNPQKILPKRQILESVPPIVLMTQEQIKEVSLLIIVVDVSSSV
mgnify:FL=1